MKKLKTNIKENIEKIKFEEQMEKAKLVAENLKNRGISLIQSAEEKAQIINTFKELVKVSNNGKKDNEKILERFEALTPESQKRALESMLDIIESIAKQEEQEKIRKICEKEGHDFGEWKYYRWHSNSEVSVNSNAFPKYQVKHEMWIRTCSKCNLVEKVYTEPEELSKSRREKERKERIEKLEKELKLLKGMK